MELRQRGCRDNVAVALRQRRCGERAATTVRAALSGRTGWERLVRAACAVSLLVVVIAMAVATPAMLLAREREPNTVFAERRARLAAQLNGPVVLFGYTGKENSSPSYVFNQEENFYYLTGHNEEGAALLVVPAGASEKGWKGPAEILFSAAAGPGGGALEWSADGADRPGNCGAHGVCHRGTVCGAKGAPERPRQKLC